MSRIDNFRDKKNSLIVTNILTASVSCCDYTVQPAYKVLQIQGMSAYCVGSPGPNSCVRIGIGIGEPNLYGFSEYMGGPEPFHISGLPCITLPHSLCDAISGNDTRKVSDS